MRFLLVAATLLALAACSGAQDNQAQDAPGQGPYFHMSGGISTGMMVGH